MNSSIVNMSELTVSELNKQVVKNVLPVTVFIGAEAIVGFVGNTLILSVYYRSYEYCNFRYFVLCLAIYDLTSCLTTLPGEVYAHFNWYNYKYDWMCKIKSYFNVFTAWGSAFTLFVLAFDRCRKVCRPLGWQIQTLTALKLCACGLILSSIVSFPILFLWGKQTYTIDDVGLNVSICEKSGIYADENYPFIYITCVYIVPVGFMMAGIFICNVLLARKLFCGMSGNKDFELTSRSRTISESSITCPSYESSDIHSSTNFISSSVLAKNFSDMEPSDVSKSFRVQEINKCSSWSGNSEDRCTIRNHVSAYFIGINANSNKTASSVTDIGTKKGDQSISSAINIGKTESIQSVSSAINVGKTVSIQSVSSANNVGKNGGNQCSSDTYIGRKRNDQSISSATNVGKNGRNKSVSSVINAGSNLSISSATNVGKNASTKNSHGSGSHRRIQKTWIILILTSVYIVTTILYISLVSRIAEKDGILRKLSDSEKAVYFFFLRLYFINSVINPILYGIMDPRFRGGVKLLILPAST